MGARSKKKLVAPELFPEQRDAAEPSHAKVSESIIVNPLGVIFSQIHSLPYNSFNLVLVVEVVTAQDDAISLPVAIRISVTKVDQPFRVYTKYPASYLFCQLDVGIVPASLVTIEQEHAVIVLVIASKGLLSYKKIRWRYSIA